MSVTPTGLRVVSGDWAEQVRRSSWSLPRPFLARAVDLTAVALFGWLLWQVLFVPRSSLDAWALLFAMCEHVVMSWWYGGF